jgi:8-oxo-dGTP pyrophosphatase MutT (NUDIX family)
MSEPKPASTVLLLRDGAGGVEVFTVRRPYVFPGGRVEDIDSAFKQDPHQAAATRELVEEAGVRVPDGRPRAVGSLDHTGNRNTAIRYPVFRSEGP